jgi:16S rRNA (guanine1207-N2)-methyltransferase
MEHDVPDPYFKQRLAYAFHGHRLVLDTAELLYSPHQIDAGSELLLATLDPGHPAPRTILSLNASYGTVAVALAARYPRAEVVVCDKDLLALRYTRRNAALNNLGNVTAVPSVGTRAVEGQSFDLIVAAIPDKIGDKVIEHDFVLAPLKLLAAYGGYWFVTASQLNRLLPNIGRRHRLNLTERARHASQIVYHIARG